MDTIFTSPTGADGTTILLVVIQATRRSSRLIEAMTIGPAPEIEPTPSRSEDKRSTDWANPVTK